MRVDLFDFDLPESLIALHPMVPREAAKLLHVDNDGHLSDRTVADLPKLIGPNDLLVVNNTRVLPAELKGQRLRGDLAAKVGVNLHKRENAQSWLAFARPAKKLKPDDEIVFSHPEMADDVLKAKIVEVHAGGEVLMAFDVQGPALDEAIKRFGAMPLPPYIGSKRAVSTTDDSDYQTIFAKHDGAVAAPTAGLHFTPALRENIEKLGAKVCEVTLHVGAGTFLPVKVQDTDDHQMHAEWGVVDTELCEQVAKTKANGGRVIAVGTTSLRILEAASAGSGVLEPFRGETNIFLTPGSTFHCVDVLMTNFHLPRSTLFMLVSAFSGMESMSKAYAHAIANQYRFYSYGDACWLLREKTGRSDT